MAVRATMLAPVRVDERRELISQRGAQLREMEHQRREAVRAVKHAVAFHAAMSGQRGQPLPFEVREAVPLVEDGRTPPPIDAVADYSGQLRLRLPKSLHEAVSQLATAEGVSLNTLMLSLIAEGCGRREAHFADAPSKPGRSGKRKAIA